MEKESSSYKQIVKSTGIFGGVQIVQVIIGIIRSKLAALLLGTEGIGLVGTIQNIIDLVKSVSSLGIENGGIRDIASSSNDKNAQIYHISVFRKWVIATSFLGAFLCIVFCYPISVWAFNTPSYSISVALLSIPLFFTSLAAGQSVIFQGLRLITILAKINLIGYTGTLVISVSFYYFLKLDGVVPSFIVSSLFLLLCNYTYLKRLNIKTTNITAKEALNKGLFNLKLGLFFTFGIIITHVSMLCIRSFLNTELDMGYVGVFNAAWSISSMYLMMVLKAMGTDFYPRLCSVSDNNNNITRLVNEQTHIVLVLVIPIIVGMFVFSKIILALLYSSNFVEGTSLLQWQILGGFFKALAWPLAFILLAKGKGRRYLFGEIIFFVVYVGLSYLLFPAYGISALGVSYLLAYITYLIVEFLLVFRLCNFRWDTSNIKIALIGMGFLGACIAISKLYPDYLYLTGSVLFLVAAIYAIIEFNKVFNIKSLLNSLKTKKKH
ncbi:O-antigen translocase [Dysgonomonas sp. 216]|uniref:O-antigen translocase n=1 Tax=Dysgonomonas sp. 216 TaxID=2302934 RepID=UPI0013D8DE0F|nr:O-antigen translocase [Dysgonomonas sp. 216]NDW19180.1 O-antigen translocase [Dysgonomonas sp. 216]